MSFFAPPTIVKRLADRAIAEADLSHLKTIIYGGAPMYLADLEGALAVFGPRLAQIYGQGEAPMTITGLALLRHPGVRAAAVVGRPDAKWGEAVVDYRFVDALPTNNYGKVVKRELRDWLRIETADGGSR